MANIRRRGKRYAMEQEMAAAPVLGKALSTSHCCANATTTSDRFAVDLGPGPGNRLVSTVFVPGGDR